MFDFETNQVVKDLATVPEQFRPLYEADPAVAGTFKLKVDPVVKGAVEAAVGLSRAIKASRSEAEGYKAKIVDLAPLKEYGEDPATIAQAIQAKIDELQGKKFDVEKVKADIAKGFTDKIAQRDEQVKKLRTQLEQHLVDNNIRSALGDQAVDPDLVLPFVKNRVKVVEADGQLAVRVVDEQGTERHTVSGLMSINDLVNEMKGTDKYKPLFKSAAPRGSSAKPGASASRPANGGSEGLSPIDKIRAGLDARARR